MSRNNDLTDLSELEREVELDMEGEYETLDERESAGSEQEWEALDSEDSDRETNDESGDLFELDQEEESGNDREWEVESESGTDSEYVDQLMEIASRQYESESEVDQELNGVLNNVATEYFFSRIKQGLRKISRNKIVRGLVKKGLKVASGQFPALKAITGLARGDLKGMLLNLGKQALGSAIPGSTAVLGALQGVGLESESGDVADREVWNNYLQISKDAFEHLADNLTEQADQPLEASRLASQAFQQAVIKAKTRRGAGGKRSDNGVVSPGRRGAVRRIRLRPGERLIISGAGKVYLNGG